jgi:hypothetical protein
MMWILHMLREIKKKDKYASPCMMKKDKLWRKVDKPTIALEGVNTPSRRQTDQDKKIKRI